MYTPKHFSVSAKPEIIRFIKANAFGQVTSLHEERLVASHLPFLLNDEGTTLLGHFAKANPQWQSIENQEVLISFQGPHDYISPSWYHSPGVPTWNYQAVHVYGLCMVIEDSEKLKGIIDSLTKTYESQLSVPWTGEYNASMLQGIVGVEIAIKEIQAKYKLNQNRSAEDRQNVIKALESKGKDELAQAMRRDQ